MHQVVKEFDCSNASGEHCISVEEERRKASRNSEDSKTERIRRANGAITSGVGGF